MRNHENFWGITNGLIFLNYCRYLDKITILSSFKINQNTNLMKELIENLQTTYESFESDAKLQLESGNKSAGTRARKSSLALEKLLKEFRKISIAESKK